MTEPPVTAAELEEGLRAAELACQNAGDVYLNAGPMRRWLTGGRLRAILQELQARRSWEVQGNGNKSASMGRDDGMVDSVLEAELPESMNSRQTSLLLNVHQKTVERWAAAGSIPAERVGARWRFSKAKVAAWKRGQTEARRRRGSPS